MTPETTQVLGTVATLYGLGGALSVLLQARQMHVRGTSGDVSARFFAVYAGGFAIWLLYGLGIGDVPIILVHAVGLLCGTATLAVVLRLRRPAAATARSAGERIETATIGGRCIHIQKDAAGLPEPGGEHTVVEYGDAVLYAPGEEDQTWAEPSAWSPATAGTGRRSL